TWINTVFGVDTYKTKSFSRYVVTIGRHLSMWGALMVLGE
ncbi:13952_t:CDS:2, partial [Rhizophagus irregularis]